MNKRTFLKGFIASIGALAFFSNIKKVKASTNLNILICRDQSLIIVRNRKLISFEELHKILKEKGLGDFYIPDFYLNCKEQDGRIVLELDDNYLVFAETRCGEKYACPPPKEPFFKKENLIKEPKIFKNALGEWV